MQNENAVTGQNISFSGKAEGRSPYITTPTSLHAASPTRQHRVRKAALGSSQVKWWLHLRWKHWLNTLSIWSGAYRSFRGHTQIQPSTELPSVRFGSELVRSPAGDLRVNTRSLARSMYTQMLTAMYPWADIADLRIFLMGFDAGEQWQRHSPYIEAEKPAEYSWLILAEKESESVPDMVAQAIKSYSGQISQ